MHNKNHSSPNSKWFPVLGIIRFLIYYSIFNYIFLNIFGLNILGILIGFLCTMLLHFVIETVKEKWRAAFTGTVYGKVVIKNNDTPTIPLKNIEISYNSPFLEKPGIPIFSDVKGMFRFERVVPVHKPITLEAKIGKDHIIYQHIGKIEGVKWFLGKPSLRLPLSSGVPKYVDFVVSTFKKI